MHAVKSPKKVVGSRAEVFHGNAKKTSGGLTKGDLMKNSSGDIVSKKKHELGMKIYKKNKTKMAPPFKAAYKCVKSPKKSPKMSPKKKYSIVKKK